MTTLFTRARAIRQSNTWIYSTMLFSALISLTASLVLSIDAVELARDPTADLSCNINSVVSCGAVGVSWQAQLLGFPNAFLGLIAEPVVITIAVAALGGVRFPRWFMIAAQTVYTIGLIFAYWLFYQAIVNIGALCPWCLLVTLSTTVVWVSLTHVNIRDDYLPMPRAWRSWAREAIANDIDLLVVIAWLLVLALIIVTRYGSALFG
ncbi:membrane protein [Actinoplanes capillaceus]|uniref:Membrane protein n=1 Tax=Actinoplanes campanulatus TaxID=113559 RepID=A0ABQ3WQ92_9ACTN|nr:vitamin K epoxide reductase family protein [Actinoplanes capillaceus]GID48451.1 membrane protein [Actinoplanes capillaceus]